MLAPSKPTTPQPEAVPGCRWKWLEGWGWALLPRRCVPPSVGYDRRPWKGRIISRAALAEIRANPPTYRPAVICDGPPGGAPWGQAFKVWPALPNLVRRCATYYRFVPNMAGRPPEGLPRWREPT